MDVSSALRILSLILIAGSTVASAEDVPPPQFLYDAIDVAPTVTSDPLQMLKFGDFEAKFEETTLAEIRDHLGAGRVAHRGDAGRSIYWLCYSLSRQLVWVASHGEMGGTEHSLTNVFAEEVGASDPRLTACPSIPLKHQPPSLSFGWLGSAGAAVQQAIGPPSGRQGDWLLFFHEGKISRPFQGLTDAESQVIEYDVTAYIEMKVRNDRVVAFRTSHITSN